MTKRFYTCAACPREVPQGFNKIPDKDVMCIHCHHWGRTWTALDDDENALYLQKHAFVTSVLNGTWTTAENNALPPADAVAAFLHAGKHYDRDKDKDAGKHDYNSFRVHAMEKKAIRLGLDVPTGAIFRWAVQIGSDGSVFADFTTNTRAMRVDSIGQAGMHSHPFPELGIGSHRQLVVAEIIDGMNKKSLIKLLRVAQYCNLIGATPNEFAMSNSEKAKLSPTAEQRACVYW